MQKLSGRSEFVWASMIVQSERAAWLRTLTDILENCELAEARQGTVLVEALSAALSTPPLQYRDVLRDLAPLARVRSLCEAGAADQAAIELVTSMFGIMVSQSKAKSIVATVFADAPFDERTGEGKSIAIALVAAAAGAVHEAIATERASSANFSRNHYN